MAEIGQKQGKRVRHPRYGEGTVQRVERGGLSLRVLFDQYPGLAVSLPSRSLRLADDESAPLAPAREGKSRSGRGRKVEVWTHDQVVRRQVLEALRLGVVPTEGLLAYTVGRDREVEEFHRILDGAETRKALALLGDYGTGKTHMLELAQHLALEKNWVVGRAWLDPQEAPPSKPRRVYSALVRSLHFPDQREAGELGLWPLLEKASQLEGLQGGLENAAGESHAFLSPALRYARALSEAFAEAPGDSRLVMLQMHFLDWIEGRATGLSQELQRRLHAQLPVRDRVLALSDFSTLSKVYGYLLSGISSLCRHAGYRGLLILLDETELFSNLSQEQRDKAVEVFRVLLAAALPGAGEAALDLSEIGEGGRGIIRRLPPRFEEESALAIGLATTPGSESEFFLRDTLGKDRVLELTSFGRREFLEMGDRILRLYLNAYPAMSKRVIAALESRMDLWFSAGQASGPREFGRRVVDFLDQNRHINVDFG